MKHEINGLRVEVATNPFQIQEAIMQKLTASPDGMSGRQLVDAFIRDLINDRFLRTEMTFNLSRLEREHFVTTDFQVMDTTDEEQPYAARVYKVRGLSESTINTINTEKENVN